MEVKIILLGAFLIGSFFLLCTILCMTTLYLVYLGMHVDHDVPRIYGLISLLSLYFLFIIHIEYLDKDGERNIRITNAILHPIESLRNLLLSFVVRTIGMIHLQYSKITIYSNNRNKKPEHRSINISPKQSSELNSPAQNNSINNITDKKESNNIEKGVASKPKIDSFGELQYREDNVKESSNIEMETLANSLWTFDPKDYNSNSKEKHPRAVRITNPDWIKIQKQNVNIGMLGELFVLNLEKNKLKSKGLIQLSSVVEHTSVVSGDGHGYDIKSYNLNSEPMYIEVKTTTNQSSDIVHFTTNEFRIMMELGSSYYLYRVYLDRERNFTEYEIFRGFDEISKNFELANDGIKGIRK